MSQISELQRALGVPQSEKWDTTTQGAVTAYQAASGLPPTGIPTPSTLAKLGIYNPLDLAPSAMRRAAAGAPTKPQGKFGMSLLSAFNQIPWYVYVGAGISSLGFAALAIRRRNRKQ